MKNDNRGFSLIELIVVIGIMAVLVGVMAANIGRLSGYRAKECRSKIVSSLDNARLQTLSKATKSVSNINDTDTYWVFVKNTNNKCNYCLTVIEGTVTEVKKISKPSVTIFYSYDDGTTKSSIGSCGFGTSVESITPAQLSSAGSAGIKIGFNRQNGAFLTQTVGGIDTDIKSMYASSGNYIYDLTLHPKTGKVEVGGRTTIH